MEAIDHKEREKLITAAKWQPASENEFGIDPMYHSFIEIMKYRREIAKRLLSVQSEDTEKELRSMMEYCNEQIYKILGV